MKIQIRNLQRIKRINLTEFRKKIRRILHFLGLENKTVHFVFCDNSFIRELSKRFFGKEDATDVISFPLHDQYSENFLGEVVISVEEVIENSKIYKTEFDEELCRCIIHGVLHLIGYRDDTYYRRKKMRDREESILKKLRQDDR